jgi:hypothetical protein
MTPLLWSVCGLSVLWTAVAGMNWWGVAFEERWSAALTLQSLQMGGGWTVDLWSLRNVTASPLGPLLGRVGVLVMPSPPLVLWALSVIGVWLLGLGLLRARWNTSLPTGPLVGIWALTLWITHPLTLSSLGMDWMLALGLMALGASLVEGGRERTGWLTLGLAMVGRTEMALGLAGVVLWRWRRVGPGLISIHWWTIALIPPALWAIIAWVVFGLPWPETWESAAVTSRSWLVSGADDHWSFTGRVLGAHPVWATTLAVLAVIGLLALRRGTAVAWAGTPLAVGCLVIHGMPHLAGGQWWWLLLGPLLGLVALAATGLAWLADSGRPPLTRLLGVIAGAVALLSQWGGHWELKDWALMREHGLCWQEAGRWLRENTSGNERIATTQPASLLWHLGVTHELSAHRVVALQGPLSDGDPLVSVPEQGTVDDTDIAEQIHALEPDLLVLRWPEDDVILNCLRSWPTSLGRWGTVAEMESPRDWRLLILGRLEGEPRSPSAPIDTDDADRVAQAHEILRAAVGSARGWEASEQTTVRAGEEGIEIVGEGRAGHTWTPPFAVPAHAVEAIEVTLQVKAESSQDSIPAQIWWEGEGVGNPGEVHRERRVMPVESSWRFRTYRLRVGDNPLWRRFATIRRLRIDPAPTPFHATVKTLRLVAAPVAQAEP